MNMKMWCLLSNRINHFKTLYIYPGSILLSGSDSSKYSLLSFNLMEASDLLFSFPFPSRMDDIQLCRDIMSLKQELRQIVAVPGKVQTHTFCLTNSLQETNR